MAKPKAPPTKPKAKVNALYVFDSSAFINPYRRYYPFDVAPGFWRAIEQRITAGEIVSNQMVKAEVEEKDDELTQWTRKQKTLFRGLTATGLERSNEVINRFPDWVDIASGRNNADPFVIGHALADGIACVSDERGGGPAKLRIPYVCAQMNVEHLTVIDFMRRIGLRFN